LIYILTIVVEVRQRIPLKLQQGYLLVLLVWRTGLDLKSLSPPPQDLVNLQLLDPENWTKLNAVNHVINQDQAPHLKSPFGMDRVSSHGRREVEVNIVGGRLHSFSHY
jgi:hypothetical protein